MESPFHRASTRGEAEVRLPEGFKDVVRACTALPGIGERSAQRFAFYLLDKPEKAREIAKR